MRMRRRAFLGTATAGLASLAGCAGDPEYRIDGVSVAGDDGPLALDVAVEDRSVTVDSPGALAFTLRNDAAAAVRVRNWGVWPLGVPELLSVDEFGRGTGARLSADAYDASDHVDPRPSGIGVDREPIVRPLPAGDRVTETYRVHGDRLTALGAGTHAVSGWFERRFDGDAADAETDETQADDAEVRPLAWYRTGEREEWATFEPEVRVTLSELSLLP